MPWYEIEALDTLFFRDGRPFTAGEDVEAHGLFPPHPMTLQGLIRSLLLTERGQPLTPHGCKIDGSGRWDDYKRGCEGCPHDGSCLAQDVVGRLPRGAQGKRVAGKLRVRGPYVKIAGQMVFPAPADLIVKKTDMDDSLCGRNFMVEPRLLCPSRVPATSNMPGALRALESPFGDEKFSSVPGWIGWQPFFDYLQNRPVALLRQGPQRNWWLPDEVAVEERRSGHVVERSLNRPMRGKLYFARHHRLNEQDRARLAFEVGGAGDLGRLLVDLPASPFGGERRGVVVRQSNDGAHPWEKNNARARIESALGSARVRGATGALGAKLVLVQPAWFRKGWFPEGWDPAGAGAEDARPNESGLPCPWVAARIERPDRIGGWDLAQNRQKPIRSFVPRASVYYFDVPDAAARAGSWPSGTPA
jgi:CRISPR-associated protein Cmr3